MATKQKTKATGKGMDGKALRASVGRSLKAKAAASKPAVELVDVTSELMGELERQAKNRSASHPKDRRKANAKAGVVDAAVVAEDKAVDAAAVAEDKAVDAAVVAEDKAVDAVYAYAEKLGINVSDVIRISKSCGEHDMLVGLAGMEITDRVVWLASQKAREFDSRVARKHSPKTGLSRVSKPKVDGEPGTGKARVTVFGHAATAVIRALRATCGMSFAQIRNVLDANGAGSVADATIRAQMAGGGLKRGEPAPLTATQIEEARAACVAVAA